MEYLPRYLREPTSPCLQSLCDHTPHLDLPLPRDPESCLMLDKGQAPWQTFVFRPNGLLQNNTPTGQRLFLRSDPGVPVYLVVQVRSMSSRGYRHTIHSGQRPVASTIGFALRRSFLYQASMSAFSCTFFSRFSLQSPVRIKAQKRNSAPTDSF